MRSLVVLILAIALFMFAGCGGTQKTETIPRGGADDGLEKRVSRYDEAGKLTKKYDLNEDKVPDVWKIYAKVKDDTGSEVEVMVRSERDLNFDGQVDIWAFYDFEGNLLKDEMDNDFDGKVDVRTYYEEGKVVKKEIDLEFDGKPDLFKYYKGGKLERKERDTNNDGKIDRLEYFEGGSLQRIGEDIDGDGDIDRWIQQPEGG